MKRMVTGILLMLMTGTVTGAAFEPVVGVPVVDGMAEVAVEPLVIRDGQARVEPANSVFVRQAGRYLVFHAVPPVESGAPVIELLYDNRDRGHSRMRLNDFPWIARIAYAEGFVEARADYGVQSRFVHNLPVLGNGSLAMTRGPYWRSLTRHLYQREERVQALADQYLNNHLYVYPAHNDYGRRHGDVYVAHTPYLITSQGSSGSDQPFLMALARTVAALEPETRRFLIEQRLLAPTLQMLLRSSLKPVSGRDDYRSGVAHPVVFNSNTLDVDRMVDKAMALRPEAIPPVVRLRVVDEDDDTVPGIDYFEAGPAEKLFDTVSAVARIARATRHERRMTVAAEAIHDANARPLTFVWRLLRGDPERVQIRLLDPEGTQVELRVAWHERGDHGGHGVAGGRVDIGVFAHNGEHDSAPAFITWYFPPNEQRDYDEDGRIRSVTYRTSGRPEHYVDPARVTPVAWTDHYRYGPHGESLGWERRRGDAVDHFTPDGKLVLERDARDRPVLAQAVVYARVQESDDVMPVLHQRPGSQRIRYTYASDADLQGEAHEEPDADEGR